MKARGYILAAVSAVTYGLIPLFILPIKEIQFSLNVTLFYRFLIASLCIGALLLYRKENLKPSKKEIQVFLSLGVLFALSSDFLFLAYDHLSAGIASTILFVYPVIVALIMAIFYHEKITKITAIALFITLIGVYFLSTRNSAFDINFIGVLIALTSALSYAIYIVRVNKAKISASGMKTTFYSILFSATYYLVKSIVLKQSLVLPNYTILAEIAVFALITSVISITTLVYAIKYIGSIPTAIMGALEPVVAVAISVTLFNEALTLNLVVGIILILAGVMIDMVFRKSSEGNQ